jgi:hypothetical protein
VVQLTCGLEIYQESSARGSFNLKTAVEGDAPPSR